MLFADKENLKTELAVDLNSVREKEMRYYVRNLSTIGTQSALLAGFAFTILSTYDFKVPCEGVLPTSWRKALGLSEVTSTILVDCTEYYDLFGDNDKEGFIAWDWAVWIQQLTQMLHLVLTALGMTVQLWTVYSCVVTNVLGLGLALRGPEGSVDQAVRHLAKQNHHALTNFSSGLLLFMASFFAFSVSEYQARASSARGPDCPTRLHRLPTASPSARCTSLSPSASRSRWSATRRTST